MKYISVGEFAGKYGVSERTARNYCAIGKIEGAFLTGKTWNIPEDAELPSQKKSKVKIMPLLAVLRRTKADEIERRYLSQNADRSYI